MDYEFDTINKNSGLDSDIFKPTVENIYVHI